MIADTEVWIQLSQLGLTVVLIGLWLEMYYRK